MAELRKRSSSDGNSARKSSSRKSSSLALAKRDTSERLASLGCDFAVPQDFDYGESSQTNYTDTRAGASHTGPYAHIRDDLDTEHHGVYTRERQALQDLLIDGVVRCGNSQRNPWLIFTAGAMGAGKSHTVLWMHSQGIFPMDEVVHVDPDLFKHAFPEWSGYVAAAPLEAGRHTRRESGLCVEIATEAAMLQQKHVWVDGSLRDANWYLTTLPQLRRRHPSYRVAILYVTAREEVIFARVKRRAEETGRSVPESEVRDSLERVPRSVVLLCPHADFFAQIDNSEKTPRLTKYCDDEMCYLTGSLGDCWEQIESRFRSQPAHSDSGPKEDEGAERPRGGRALPPKMNPSL